ncbi:MAG: hypothetical protein COA57_10675 [Flavobacteriales bacterium]|nr:MAG: hypothetical protein COA57_10675 [Flavobacteriales bacterium]
MLRPFFIFALMVSPILPNNDFKQDQLKYSRVRNAYKLKESTIKVLFQQKGIDYNSFEIFLRAFKKEKKLQLFAKSKKNEKFKLLKTYNFCMLSGKLGPKRKQGDLQVPEGFYHIDRFNPASSYHLSLGVNYPNKSDRISGNRNNLGGDIFIHGNCVSIGCIPITDDKIKELYVIAVEAKSKGQAKIPVHIFPAKMDVLPENKPELKPFWKNLKRGYDYFEKNKKLPKVTVDAGGKYIFGS